MTVLEEALQSVTSVTTRTTARRPTGLGSFDNAFGGGLRNLATIEMAGNSNSGKTTLAMAVAAALSAPDGRVGLIDLEGDGDGIYAGASARACPAWKGDLWVSPFEIKGNGTLHADRVDLGLKQVDDPKCTALVLDSVGMYSSAKLADGSVEDANVGQNARAMSNMMRILKIKLDVRKGFFTWIAINHIHDKIGKIPGSETAGGKMIQYGHSYRVRVWADRDEGFWTLNGTVTKRRSVGEDEFSVIMIPGFGVHWGLTAVNDCVAFGLASKERTVKLGDKSYGYWKNMVEQKDDLELFAPFLERSANYVKEKWA